MANQGLVDATDVDVTKEGTRVPLSEVLKKKADLDEEGKVPSSMLPSYVDDVLEFASVNAFPSIGETGKIYVALDTNQTYRWSGTTYVEISKSLALGETSSTAYAGNKGKQNADDITEIFGILDKKISDAPSDNEQYVRKNGAWAKVDIKTSADGISYDNTESDLDAENVQEAIDELNQNDLELEDYGSQEIPGLEEAVISRLNNQDVEIANAKLDIQQKYSEFVDAAGGVKSITDARLMRRLTSMDAIPVFDENVSYKQNDIVNYNGQPYYFEKDHKGSWTGFDVVATDLFALIIQARGQIFTGEVVNIRLFCDEASISLANVKVVCNFEDGSAQKVAYTDENGEATFFVSFGKRYGISAERVGDFECEKRVYSANNFSRNVTLEYNYQRQGIYAFFDNGTKMYYDSWVSNGKPLTDGFGGNLFGAYYYEDGDEHWVLSEIFKEACNNLTNVISSLVYADDINTSVSDAEKYSQLNKNSVGSFKTAYNKVLTLYGVEYHGILGSTRQIIAAKNNETQIFDIISKKYLKTIKFPDESHLCYAGHTNSIWTAYSITKTSCSYVTRASSWPTDNLVFFHV